MKRLIALFIIIMCFLGLNTICYAEPYSTETDSNFEYYVTYYEGTNDKYALIDDYFGENSAGITSIVIPSTTPNGVPVTGIQMNGNEWGDYLTSITIPSSIDEVSGKFNTATALTQIILQDGVNTIAQNAFYGCSGLTSITIPSSVTSIGEGAFDGCSSLQSISVDTGNENYKSTDGVLFNKDADTLIRYPEGKTDTAYTMPSNVTSIGDNSFKNCDNLESITIGDNVTTIGAGAFYDCDELNNVVIPKNVTNIEGGTFYSCNKLKKLTILIKENITIGNGLTNSCSSVVIYCYENSYVKNYVMSDYYTELCSSWHPLPEVKNKIPDQSAQVGTEFDYTLPDNIFNDTRDYDYTYTATELPNGITFDGDTKTFSGTPTATGSYDITVTMAESENSVSDTFTININSAGNTAPTVANEIPDGTATVGSTFVYTIPENTFTDAENDYLTYEMSTTSSAITFHSDTREVTFTPSEEGTISVTIIATDTSGAAASDTFDITATKPLSFTTLSVSNITKTSADIFFTVDEDCSYTVAVLSPREDNNYGGPGWGALTQGRITGNCAEGEEVQKTVTQILSNEPIDLQVATEYALCVRIKDSDDNYVIGHVLFTTMKNDNMTTPDSPVLESKTYNSIALVDLSGYEYSKDNGVNWQDSSVFSGLNASTNYTFIQRIKEIGDTYASSNSDELTVTTNNRPSSGGSSSRSSRKKPSKSVDDGITIKNSQKGDDTAITIKQENVEITFNGEAFTNLKNKNVQAKIEEIDKKDLDIPSELEEQIGDLPIFDISIYVDGDKAHFESDEPIVIEIPVDTDLDNHKVVAVYIDDNSNTQIMEGMLVDGVMKFTTNHLSNYALIYVNKSFDDVITHWGKEAIEAFASREVVNGVGNDMFNPEGKITRAEFVTIMVRYFDLTSDSTDNYSDVETDRWYTENIAIAKDNDILPNIYGDTFEPNKAITREEMMYILYKSLEITNRLDDYTDNGDSLTDFMDSDMVADYAKEGSEYLISRDIINGSGNDMFNPTSTSSRAEVAQMLWNMLNQ